MQEALALIQKTNAAGGGSLHESLVKLLVKVAQPLLHSAVALAQQAPAKTAEADTAATY